MPRRSLLTIYAGILEAVSEGVRKPTRIMYRTNLSWLPVQRHLTLLVEKEFLKESNCKSRKVYDITEAGRTFLRHINLVKKELTEGSIVHSEGVAQILQVKKRPS